MEAHSVARSQGGLALPRSRKLLGALGDERLVEQLRRGNEAAFEVLYDRHHAAVLSYCRHMLGSRDEAEDALQQAFVSAHADIVASDKAIRFKAWIYTIARNRCLSLLRARREHPSEDLERVSTAGLSEEVEQRQDLRHLLADLRELPEEQRAALILSELGDLSHAEIAEVIDCEPAKVKSLVFQARSGLIERRQARETPCEEIREQLATLRGGSLRRGPLRRHLRACPGCAEFRKEVKRQRHMVAAILPVVPTLGLKESALAAVGVGAGSAGGGLLAAGGGLGAAVAAKAGVAKVAVIAVATTGAVGGAVAVERVTSDSGSSGRSAQGADGATTGGAAGATSAGGRTGDDAGGKALQGKEGGARERGAADERKRRVTREGARERGLTPFTGESNGERARDFAGERGNGGHRGLDKQKTERADSSRGLARGHTKERQTPQRSTQSPGPRNGDTRPQPAPQGQQKPAPKPEMKPAPQLPLLPELTPRGGKSSETTE